MSGDSGKGIDLTQLHTDLQRLRKAATKPPLDELSAMGVTIDEKGTVHAPKEALMQIRESRMRRATISSVPSTPRHIYRDAGGVGMRKGAGRFETFPFEALRRVRERSPYVQMIHSTRHIQIAHFCKRWSGKLTEVGYRVVHKNHLEHDAKPPESIKPFIRRFENLLAKPCPRYEVNNLAALLVPLWDDFATINRPVVEILRSVWDKNHIVGFRPVDGNLIWPTMIWLEKWMADNPRFFGDRDPDDLSPDAALHLINEIVGHDVRTADYCVVREGILEGVFDSRNLIVAPRYNRTDIQMAGYPPSYVEQAIEFVLSAMNTHEFNSALFTRGFLSEFMLAVIGEYSDEAVDVFVDGLRDASMGIESAHNVPILALPDEGDIRKIDLKPPPKDMAYETWQSLLLTGHAGIYRMDMSELGMKPWDGGKSGALSAPSRADEIKSAKEEGLGADLDHLAENVLTPLAQTCHPDLRVIWHWGNHDPKAEAEIAEIRGRVHVTRNELRLQDGQRPMGFWLPQEEYEKASDEDKQKYEENPWNWPTDSGFAQAMQAKAAAKQQEEQMKLQQEQGGQPGEPGAPGEGGGEQPPEDDGFGNYAGTSPDEVEGPPDQAEQQPEQGMEKGRPFRIIVRHIKPEETP